MNTSHYPSLERCKRLTESNFPETEHSWRNDEFILGIKEDYISRVSSSRGNYVCPSIMELLDKLPKKIKSSVLEISFDDIESTIYYDSIYFTQGPLPDALTEMYLYLEENNYI